jgi:hypothetical protein
MSVGSALAILVVLDDQDVHLTAGDIVVLRGANHA